MFLAAIAITVSAVPTVAAQQESKPLDLPNGPAKPGFDIKRFSNAGNGWFETFYVRQTEPLQKVLDDRRVAADTRVLVLQTANGKLALLMDQMAYHHVGMAASKKEQIEKDIEKLLGE
jgi:hypothetical protein